MSETKSTRLCVSVFVAVVILVGGLPLLAVPARADPGWTLRDDATGGDCTLIGVWDGSTKTCTLTTDVFQGIDIVSDGITLDGAGHSISASPGLAGLIGINAGSRSGVTVKNARVIGFYISVIPGSSGNTVSGNTLLGGGGFGVSMRDSTANTISGNSISGNQLGIQLITSTGNTISGNIISDGILMWPGSDGNTIRGNTVSGSFSILFNFVVGAVLEGNTMFGGGIAINGGPLQHWNTHTIDDANTINGKPVQYCKDTPGAVIPPGAGQVILANCADAVVRNQDVSAGIRVAFSTGVSLTGNRGYIRLVNSASSFVIENVVTSMALSSSPDATVIGNTVLSNVDFSNSPSTVTGNTVSVSGGYSLRFSNSPSTVAGNTVSGGNGIRFSNSPSTVTGNTVSVSGGSFSYGLFPSSPSTVTGNTVSGGGRGIWLRFANGNIVRGNAVSGSAWGIILEASSDGNTVRENTVSGSSARGITLAYSSGNTVGDNTVSDSGYGISVDHSSGNTVSGNTVSDNPYRGITLDYADGNTVSENTLSGSVDGIVLDVSDGNTVSGNAVSDSGSGIWMSSSSGNTISGNTVSGNAWSGIWMRWSNGNAIFHNNLIRNQEQLFSFESENTWDDGAGRGNYWSDYRGRDDGSGGRVKGDGVGDTDLPHQGVDWYPLMRPL